jgi:hypothetical protein
MRSFAASSTASAAQSDEEKAILYWTFLPIGATFLAMILAGAALLTFFHEEEASRVSRAIYEATFEAVLDGIRTADLGGSAGTTEFADEVIRHVRNKLEVWSALA